MSQEITFFAPALSSSLRTAVPAAPAPAMTILTSARSFPPAPPQRVRERAEHDDRGSVLVVVEHRDVKHAPQPPLHLEAARRRDVLEVDPAEAGGDGGDR